MRAGGEKRIFNSVNSDLLRVSFWGVFEPPSLNFATTPGNVVNIFYIQRV